MRGLILAAGEGTRLRPLTADRPKPMVAVAGIPMIAYALDWMRANGVTEVAINTHYRPEPLVQFVGDGAAFGLSVRYSHEPVLLGSSGALAPLQTFFRDEACFVVLYGDVLTNQPLGPVIDVHFQAKADATLVLTEVDDPRRAGMVELDAQDGIHRLVEKPRDWPADSRWANGGIYLLGPGVWDFAPSSGYHDFGFDLLPAMLAAGRRLHGFRSHATLVDIGSHERLGDATRLVERGGLPRPQVVLSC
ncbi:MAG TPA: nucleotidyltransferase family protein [Acidimicrobiales bacterium]|nr:nucleotidyltransferase family protein [Gemmatimonadales bacterium]HWW52195.1 nucleotidyltransferase family protein [Acidimicrobiales bacterium]